MAIPDPELSIGVLAHNEEPRIGETLRALFVQDVFEKYSTEVIIVPNGCTDQTAAVATQVIGEFRAKWSVRGSAKVVELQSPGKANAWNQFVHKHSSTKASVLFLMDADIMLLSSNTISSMFVSLKNTLEAVVCVDRPIKDIAMNARRTLIQRLLVAATPEINPNNVPLCGHLYCVRSDEIRQIALPTQIQMEDGFIRALLLTKGFTQPENKRRIILDPNGAHRFASVATLREAFKHEVWVVAGSIVNMMLFRRFSVECSPDRSATSVMQTWQGENPDWLAEYVQSQVQKRGWSLLPQHWWIRRWSRLRGLPLRQKCLRIPVAAIAASMDMIVFIAAIRDVRRGRAFGYWGRM